MNDEVSRKAVLILVAVAVLISILSTTLVITTVYNFDAPLQQSAALQQDSGPATGRAILVVPQPPPAGKAVITVPDQTKKVE